MQYRWIFVALLSLIFSPAWARDINLELITAAQKGKTETVKYLLDKGVDVNAKDRFGWTALIKAAMFGYNDIVKILLDKGADVNAKTNLGCTALMEAAKIGHVTTMQILLDNNADINATDKDGNTALMDALMGGDQDVIELLSKAKDASSTIKTKDSVDFVQKVMDEKTEMNEKNKDNHNGKHLYFFGFLK